MTQKVVWRGVLIAVLTVALVTQGLADKPRLVANASSGDSFQKLGGEVLIGIVVAAVAAVAVVVVLVTHHKPQRITGLSMSATWSLATSETLGPAAYMVVSRARWRRLRGASSRALTSSRLIMIGSFRSLLGNGIRSMLTCRLSVCV